MFVDNWLALCLRKLWTLAFSMGVLAVCAFADLAQAQSDADEIRGFPDVIDADVLRFGQQRVILWGVDAPERPQKCQLNGVFWGCYDAAKRQLQLLAGRGEVSCSFRGEPDPFNPDHLLHQLAVLSKCIAQHYRAARICRSPDRTGAGGGHLR